MARDLPSAASGRSQNREWKNRLKTFFYGLLPAGYLFSLFCFSVAPTDGASMDWPVVLSGGLGSLTVGVCFNLFAIEYPFRHIENVLYPGWAGVRRRLYYIIPTLLTMLPPCLEISGAIESSPGIRDACRNLLALDVVIFFAIPMLFAWNLSGTRIEEVVRKRIADGDNFDCEDPIYELICSNFETVAWVLNEVRPSGTTPRERIFDEVISRLEHRQKLGLVVTMNCGPHGTKKVSPRHHEEIRRAAYWMILGGILEGVENYKLHDSDLCVMAILLEQEHLQPGSALAARRLYQTIPLKQQKQFVQHAINQGCLGVIETLFGKIPNDQELRAKQSGIVASPMSAAQLGCMNTALRNEKIEDLMHLLALFRTMQETSVSPEELEQLNVVRTWLVRQIAAKLHQLVIAWGGLDAREREKLFKYIVTLFRVGRYVVDSVGRLAEAGEYKKRSREDIIAEKKDLQESLSTGAMGDDGAALGSYWEVGIENLDEKNSRPDHLDRRLAKALLDFGADERNIAPELRKELYAVHMPDQENQEQLKDSLAKGFEHTYSKIKSVAELKEVAPEKGGTEFASQGMPDTIQGIITLFAGSARPLAQQERDILDLLQPLQAFISPGRKLTSLAALREAGHEDSEDSEDSKEEEQVAAVKRALYALVPPHDSLRELGEQAAAYKAALAALPNDVPSVISDVIDEIVRKTKGLCGASPYSAPI